MSHVFCPQNVKTQEGPQKEGNHRNEAKENEEENYEEEEEDTADGDKRTNRRAEM